MSTDTEQPIPHLATINKLYLELAHVAKARNFRECDAAYRLARVILNVGALRLKLEALPESNDVVEGLRIIDGVRSELDDLRAKLSL